MRDKDFGRLHGDNRTESLDSREHFCYSLIHLLTIICLLFAERTLLCIG